MTGRPAAFSALALASTASVADSEIAATRAETLVGMGSIVAPGGLCPAALWHPVAGGPAALWHPVAGTPPRYSAGPAAAPRGLAVRRGGPLDGHCLDRQPSCRLRQHARVSSMYGDLCLPRSRVVRDRRLCLKAVLYQALLQGAKGSSSIGQSS